VKYGLEKVLMSYIESRTELNQCIVLNSGVTEVMQGTILWWTRSFL